MKKWMIIALWCLLSVSNLLGTELRLRGVLEPYDHDGHLSWSSDKFSVRFEPRDQTCIRIGYEVPVDRNFKWTAGGKVNTSSCEDFELLITGVYQDFVTFPESFRVDLAPEGKEEVIVEDGVRLRLFSLLRARNEAFERGRKAREARRYDEAIDWYKKSKVYRADRENLREIADTFLEAEDYEKCIDAYQDLIAWLGNNGRRDEIPTARIEQTRCRVRKAGKEATKEAWQAVGDGAKTALSEDLSLNQESEILGYWLDSFLVRTGAGNGDLRRLSAKIVESDELEDEWIRLQLYVDERRSPTEDFPGSVAIEPQQVFEAARSLSLRLGRTQDQGPM